MKIYLDSVGCRLNQSEIEQFARQFRAAGHTLVGSAAEADLVVVNTCAVTAAASSDSRSRVRQAARAGGAGIAVTGCWATLEPGAAAGLPGVTRVVDNMHKDALVADLLGLPAEVFDLEPLAREPLPGLHLRTRAFIKVQDGCDNHCTFCITRVARGAGRSRPLDEVLADVNSALAGGAQEVVLTGVHLGSWGQDFTAPAHLYDLARALLERTAAPRLRLSSLEPWDLDERFFSLWEDPRLCRHLHLPLQSGCAGTLRRMARNTTPEAYARLLDQARQVAPEMAITTDMIVGFPGESEAEFAESLAFVKQMAFSGGHVFSYSPRSGTPAVKLPGPVASAIKKQRSAAMRAVFAESASEYARRFVGSELDVLWEAGDSYGPDGWRMHGLSDNYLRVTTTAPEKMWNQISRVQIDAADGEGLRGRIVG
ncbi:MAG: MiaB/RimO family radical SAM methylthiotransferase [Anaerolineaceae bacterium]|nr:MiaB/RimO family radical SAM methylthiotransferase [Anaerolineaceae bacterium]